MAKKKVSEVVNVKNWALNPCDPEIPVIDVFYLPKWFKRWDKVRITVELLSRKKP